MTTGICKKNAQLDFMYNTGETLLLCQGGFVMLGAGPYAKGGGYHPPPQIYQK